MDINAEVSSSASGLGDELLVLLHVECRLENGNAREQSQNELPCENLTDYVCATSSVAWNSFFQHLSSFSTFLSQSNEDSFNTELNFFFFFFGGNFLVSAEIELIFFLAAVTMLCFGFIMRIMLISQWCLGCC